MVKIGNTSTGILISIGLLKRSVIRGSATVSYWYNEAEAIRERIRRLWGSGNKNELNNELERVVDMAREREQQGIQNGNHVQYFI